MSPLPKPQPSTVTAIYDAYVQQNAPRDGRSISVSTLAEECERKLWFDFRWVSPHEQITGRQLRLFETGNIEEDRWIENLRMIGCEVVSHDDRGGQIKVEACDGHVRGYLDSEILGLPEAPKTIHVGEMKSHNAKSFAALKKDGVRKGKPLHYAQIQTYMYLRGRERGIYLAVCKDTDELYAERLHPDTDHVMRLLARAQRIIDSRDLPTRLHDDPNAKMAFACGWCRHRPVCHEGEWPRVNCRTCIFASPESGGQWACARFNKPLSNEEQQAGCPAHIYLPAVVPGEQVDANEEEEWIEYRLKDGSIWRDGVTDQPAA